MQKIFVVLLHASCTPFAALPHSPTPPDDPRTPPLVPSWPSLSPCFSPLLKHLTHASTVHTSTSTLQHEGKSADSSSHSQFRDLCFSRPSWIWNTPELFQTLLRAPFALHWIPHLCYPRRKLLLSIRGHDVLRLHIQCAEAGVITFPSIRCSG